MVKGVFNQNNQQQFTVEMKREDVKSFSDIMVFNSIDKNYDGVLQEAEVREYDAQQAKLNKGFEIAPEKQKTLSQIIKADKEAKKAFLDQLEDDGWAADVADGISILWNSKNRASKVREDFDESKSVINKLVEAAKVSDAEFLKAFKNAYGVDYNQELIDEYFKNPTKETFEKAFGTVQKDMTTRVKKYNESQEKGAKAVKNGAKMAAGVAVAVATGGTSLVATAAGAGGAALATAVTTTATTSLAATAVGTAAASIVIEETDRLKVTELLTEGDVEFREGTDHKQILTEGAVAGISVYFGGKLAQGVKMIVPANVSINSVGEVIEVALTKGQKAARTALTMVGDVVIGAGEEYITTGDVTLLGTVQNAAFSGLGSAVEYGFFKDGVKLIKGKLGFAAKNADEVLENLSSSNVVKNDAGIEVVNVKKKRYTIGDETPTTQAPKANDAGIEINTKKKPVFGLVDENPVAKSQVKPQAEVAPDVNTSSASSRVASEVEVSTASKPFNPSSTFQGWLDKLKKSASTGTLNVDGQRIELDANTGVIIKDAVDKVSNGEVSEGVINALVSRKAEGGWEEAFNCVKKGSSNDEIYQNVVRQHADVSGTDAMWDLYNNFGIESTPDDALGILIQKRYDARLKLRDDVAELVNYAQNNTNAAPLRAVRYENGSTVTEGFMIDGKSLGTWLEEGKRAGDYTNLVSRMNQGDQSYTFDWMAGTSMDQNFQNNSLGATKFKWNIEAGVGDAHGVYTDVVYSPLHASEVEWLMAEGTTLDINRAWVDDNGVVNFDARVRGNAESPTVLNPQSVVENPSIATPQPVATKVADGAPAKVAEPSTLAVEKRIIDLSDSPNVSQYKTQKEVLDKMDELQTQMTAMVRDVEVDLDNQIHAAQSQLEGLEASKPSSLESSIEYQNSRNDFNRFHNEAINIRKNLTLLETQQGQVENALSRYSSLLSDLEESLDQCKAIHGVPDNTIGKLYNHTPKPRKRVVTSKPKDDVMEIVMPDNLSASYIRDDIADLYNRFQVPSLKGKENVLIEIRAKLGMLEEELNNVNRQISNQEQNLSLANAQSDIAIGKASSLEDEYNSLLKDFNAKKQSIEQSIKDLKRAKTQAVNNVLDTPAYRGLKNFWKQLQGRARELS